MSAENRKSLPEVIRKPAEKATGIARNVGLPSTLLFLAIGAGALAFITGAATIAAHEANKSLRRNS